MNARVIGLARNHDRNGSISFSTLITGSPPTSSTDSTSDLDSQVSFFFPSPICSSITTLTVSQSVSTINNPNFKRILFKRVILKFGRSKTLLTENDNGGIYFLNMLPLLCFSHDFSFFFSSSLLRFLIRSIEVSKLNTSIVLNLNYWREDFLFFIG